MDERSLLKLYMELTGATESGARNVFMYVCLPDGGAAETADEIALKALPNGEPGERTAPLS